MEVRVARGVNHRTAIILAGGDGARLRTFTRSLAGTEVPKQFCRVIGNSTLLEQTRHRVALSVCPERTFFAVTRQQSRFYEELLGDVPDERMVVQPSNRGTAPAIFYSMMRVAEACPNSTLAVFPSDHYLDSDRRFMAHVDAAFEAVEQAPDLVVLLGISPSSPECSYGWIEPGVRLDSALGHLMSVHRFVEKPAPQEADEMIGRGGLWNSFVMVAQTRRLMALADRALGALASSMNAIRPSMYTVFERAAVERLYLRIAPANFSHEVLARFPEDLATIPVFGVDWSDIGEPKRVAELLRRLGIEHKFVAA
jgi:mannose-1-phosphate guanylyltransferase